jgi:ATP-binding cassette subfamily B protein
MSRLSNDIDAVNDVVTDTVFGLARNLFTAIATLVLMLRFTWELTLVVLVLIPLISLPARKAGRASYRARTRTQGKLAEMTAYLQEILGISGILLVKAFVKTRAERERFGGLNAQVRRLQIQQEMIARWFGMLMTVFQACGPALIMGFGGWLVLTGRTTVGTVFVFATVLGGRLTGSLSALATMHVNVVGSLAVFRRLFEYIDLPPGGARVGEGDGLEPDRAVRRAEVAGPGHVGASTSRPGSWPRWSAHPARARPRLCTWCPGSPTRRPGGC